MTLAKKDQWKPPIIIDLLDEDDVHNLEYYKNELEETNRRFELFKKQVSKTVELGKVHRYEKDFRDMLSGYCEVKHNIRTILQCIDIIRKGECKPQFYNICKTRKKILKKLEI